MATATLDETPPPPAPPAAPPTVGLTAAGDPTPPPGTPLILTDAYFQLNGVNLRCFVKHLEACAVDVQKVTVTTMCARTDYPGTEKWTLKVTFYQCFDPGTVYDTLSAAVAAYKANGTLSTFQARPHSSQVAGANNPIISGSVVPTSFPQMEGDAGAASEVVIEWDLQAPPNVDKGAVAATGATAGMPGYFTPTGATTPANLAALTGITASPNTAWTAGQYVITADHIGAHWSGSAWVVGVA
jgi:hypothetical protein